MNCGSPETSVSSPFVYIRRKHSASCYDVQMCVENDAAGWSVEVHDRHHGRKLHSARRCSLEAAKLAAAEFAVMRMTGGAGAATIEVVAAHLPWNKSW